MIENKSNFYSDVKKFLNKNSVTTPKYEVSDKEIYVDKSNLHNMMKKIETEFSLDMLFDHIIVDYLDINIFHLIYHLYSTKHNHDILIVTEVDRKKPIIDTVSDIWRIAEWQEREAYDLFGILYRNHPDLRRIFLEDDWIGYPLRKNYEDNFMLEK